MTDKKELVVRLFFNLSNRTFYIQIGESLIAIRDKIVTEIQEREGLDIHHVSDIKAMQEFCNKK